MCARLSLRNSNVAWRTSASPTTRRRPERRPWCYASRAQPGSRRRCRRGAPASRGPSPRRRRWSPRTRRGRQAPARRPPVGWADGEAVRRLAERPGVGPNSADSAPSLVDGKQRHYPTFAKYLLREPKVDPIPAAEHRPTLAVVSPASLGVSGGAVDDGGVVHGRPKMRSTGSRPQKGLKYRSGLRDIPSTWFRCWPRGRISTSPRGATRWWIASGRRSSAPHIRDSKNGSSPNSHPSTPFWGATSVVHRGIRYDHPLGPRQDAQWTTRCLRSMKYILR